MGARRDTAVKLKEGFALEGADGSELSEKHKLFCREYIRDYNGARAMVAAGYAPKSARQEASTLLTNPNIRKYINHLQHNIAEVVGITREMILNEHRKIAFSSIAHLHKTWIELKDFEKLTAAQRECIQEIQTTTIKGKKMVKIKLYDKQKALDAINRMLGYDAATKIENVNPPTQALQVNVYTSGPPMADAENKLEIKRNGKEE